MTKSPEPSIFDDAISIEELAKITGRTDITLRQWARLGILPGKRIGPRIFLASRSLFLQSLTNGLLSDRFSAREVTQILQKLQPTQEVQQ